MTTYDCPVSGCNEAATLKVIPINDGRLARSRERLVCANGHDVAAGLTPPRDDRTP